MPRKRKQDAEPSTAERRNAVLQAIEDGYTEEGNLLHDLFRGAVALEREKRETFSKIAANRRSLRDLAGQGLANREDVDALYPPKQDKADDESADTITTA